MLGRQPVRVTYAHKRRRVQNTSKKLLSSPLEALAPEKDDLTCTQMARRMLKRSRRVALAEHLEDKNVEHIREHLAKRIKHTQEHVSNDGPGGMLSGMLAQDDAAFETPFLRPSPVHEPAVAKPSALEQLSPVPLSRRALSGTSSKTLKENSMHSQTLASPFRSRPTSAVSSPKYKGSGRSSRQVSRRALYSKSRALSGVLKENIRLSRKGSAVSLKDASREPPAKHIKHRRYPSSPSTSYMRSQFAQDDWIAYSPARSCTFDYEKTSPGGLVHSDSSFYTHRPLSCSTPVTQLRKPADLRERQARTSNLLAFSLRKDSTEAGGLDVEMTDGTVPRRRQTVHLSENSIFSSSDDFTIGSLPARDNAGAIIERNNTVIQDEAPSRVAAQASVLRKAVEKLQTGYTLAGSFIAEYRVPLSDKTYSPALSASTKILGPEGVPKLSVGKQPFSLPGTSPAHEERCTIHASTDPGSLTPPVSPPRSTASSPPCPPSSPASDLAYELQSMDICGNADTHSDGESCPVTSISLQTRCRSLQDTLAKPITKKSVGGRPVRNRAGTIRASDFVTRGVSSSEVATRPGVSSLSNVRRTRSGTVVGPGSKLATKGVGLSSRAAKGVSTARLETVHSGSGFESDDELLLKSVWIEDLEYLGLAVTRSRKDVEADEMNLCGLWRGVESGTPRRLGMRRR